MEERWLLCADPDSRQIYTLNTNTNEIHIECDVDSEYRQKAIKTINDIENLLQLNKGNWLVVSQQVDKYRRRQIPSYLLQKQSSSIPVYLSQSTLSLAFSHVSTIQLRVKLNLYKNQLSFDAQQVVEIDAGLVTCADEIIKNVLRQVYKTQSVKLELKSSLNQFVLQVSGFKEYLTGSQPIMSFDRVRICLRGLKFLEVILTEVPKTNEQSDKFPPVVIRNKGQFPVIDWKTYLDVPILLWYTPFKVPPYKDECDWLEEQDKLGTLQANPINVQEVNRQSFQKVVDLQNQTDKQVQQLYKQYKQKDLRGNNELIYSGECDFPFRVSLLGIENLLQLFEQDLSKLGKLRATYNGIMPLQFITKADAKPEGQHNTAKKKIRSLSEGQQAQAEFSLKLKGKKQAQQIKEPLKNLNQLKFVPFGGVDCQEYINIIQEVYGVDFVPYLMSIKVALFHGSKLLTSWSQIDSRSIPFSIQPKFNQEINFPGIRISQLPLETKLCLNIVVHSVSGLQQIIGSAYLFLFDEDMSFRQGISQLNIWPFCKVDSRLSCMTQYWGLRDLNRSKDIQTFVQREYSKVMIKLDRFSHRVRWSLRDENTMQNYGFPKEAKNKQYYQMKLKSNPQLLKMILAIQKSKIPKEHQIKTQISILNSSRGQQHNERQKGTATLNQRGSFSESKQTSRVASGQIQINRQATMSPAIPVQQSKEELLINLYPYKDWSLTPRTEDLAYMQNLLKVNPLDRQLFTEQDRYTLMLCRNHYKTLTEALQIFLMAIDWADPEQVREAQRMIRQWTPISGEDALPLVDAQFADEYVRLYAVERLSELSDDELALYMLEFTQAIMFEKNVLNALSEMLLERSLQNPWVVGHELFWLLRSQLHVKPSFERFALILEQLLMLSGSFRQDLLNEVMVNDQIIMIAEKVKEIPNEQRLLYLREQMSIIGQKFPKPFSFALDSRMEAQDFKPEKCKVLDSKKLPLWLVTTTQQIEEDDSTDLNIPVKEKKSEVIMIIFKTGDDIRQDLLTLQLIKIMDKIWLDAGMDFRMKPYKVIATADQVGMIEVVRNSETTSQIHHDAGHLGAFNSNSILTYLKQKNTTEQALQIATDNFIRSCAGYCVATYILGIGDRHSGNIMLAETGHLFHIDFGHFLGNFKSKFGINRERAPFVFTQEMAFVMGGKEGKLFKQFEEYCTTAYNMVRKHGQFLINIFLMNLSAGMPELQSSSDVKYLQDQLDLNISDQEAITKFRQEIRSSLNDNFRKMDNFIHNIKRKG